MDQLDGVDLQEHLVLAALSVNAVLVDLADFRDYVVQQDIAVLSVNAVLADLADFRDYVVQQDIAVL